jgi:hypothetical protein
LRLAEKRGTHASRLDFEANASLASLPHFIGQIRLSTM